MRTERIENEMFVYPTTHLPAYLASNKIKMHLEYNYICIIVMMMLLHDPYVYLSAPTFYLSIY